MFSKSSATDLLYAGKGYTFNSINVPYVRLYVFKVGLSQICCVYERDNCFATVRTGSVLLSYTNEMNVHMHYAGKTERSRTELY